MQDKWIYCYDSCSLSAVFSRFFTYGANCIMAEILAGNMIRELNYDYFCCYLSKLCYNNRYILSIEGRKIMELHFILQNTVLSIESLEDYYFSQIDKMTKDVEKKIKKYIPGAMIDRYLYAKATNQEELLNDKAGEKIRELAEKIIHNITINENETTYSVLYKLDDAFANSDKYEINPTKAAREYRKLSERVDILNKSTLILLLIKYEESISNIFKYVISRFPSAYLNDKTLSYSEILEIKSEFDVIKETLLEREIDEIMRTPISNWYKLLKDKHKIHFENIDDYFEEFKEIYYRRNIIVHNNGKVNSAYLNGVEKKYRENIKQGTILTVDKEYIKKAFNLVNIVLYGTILAVSDINKDSYLLHDLLHDYAFQHMIDNNWDVSLYVYKNIMTKKTPSTTTTDSEMWKINYWISLKNKYGIESIREEVNNYDVSAMEGRYKIAKACLLNNYKEINSLLEIYINTQIYPQNIEDWPLFIQYRKSAEYKKFKKEHASDFKSQVYSPEDIQRDDMCDDILENSDRIP